MKRRSQAEGKVPPLAVRDAGPYSARNSSKGALVREAGAIFAALASGTPLGQVRKQAHTGGLLRQTAYRTRYRIWQTIHYRYLAPRCPWIVEDLVQAALRGTESREFLSLLCLHYCLRDRLVFDFVTEELWRRRLERKVAVSVEDLLGFLDRASDAEPQVRRWAESSRRKLAAGVLAALRDFGVLKGLNRKRIAHPDLPAPTALHLLRLLTEEGARGATVLEDRAWRLFFYDTGEVARMLARLDQEKRIRFERAGHAVVLRTPPEWTSGS